MGSITLNQDRNGNFTSSEIVALTSLAKDQKSFGKPALTYIEETNMERRLGRSLDTEENARNLSWGKLIEKYISDNPKLLGLNYSVNLSDTTVHPTIHFWAGSEDVTKEDTVGDIKAPRTLKSFCQLVDAVAVHGLSGMEAMHHIIKTHKEGEKYFYQLVSNACIHNKQFGELIVFVPYQSQLNEIRELAANWDNPEEAYKYAWINSANDEELPYLIDGGFYKNLNVIRFEIHKADKEFLTEKVLAAGKLLVEQRELV